MKKIAFVLAATLALVSCQKETLVQEQPANDGSRTIEAYFVNPETKTTLDACTPEWNKGDVIRLLSADSYQYVTVVDGTTPDICEAVIVEKNGKKAGLKICTTLAGPLYAVYPASATKATSQTDDVVNIVIPEEQDGTFACANICVAKEGTDGLAFKNVTAVIHLTQSASTGVDKVKIISEGALNPINGRSTASAIVGEATVDMSQSQPAASLKNGGKMSVQMSSASVQKDYYIAVAPTTLKKGTAFGFDNSAACKLGGTNLKENKTLEVNTIYNAGAMDGNSYHEYVAITTKDGKTLKWATMNIGATSDQPGEASFGAYFSWANTEGQVYPRITKPFSDDNYKLTLGYKITSQGDWDVTVHDAARANWGGTWRIPTGGENGEFAAMKEVTTWTLVGTDFTKGVKVNGYNASFNGKTIFFPLCGYYSWNTMQALGQFADFWSSTMFDATQAYGLDLNNANVTPASHYLKNLGRSIRAVSE